MLLIVLIIAVIAAVLLIVKKQIISLRPIDVTKFRDVLMSTIRKQGYQCQMDEGDLVMLYNGELYWLYLGNSCHGNRMIRLAIIRYYFWDGIKDENPFEMVALSNYTAYKYQSISHLYHEGSMIAAYQTDVRSEKEIMTGLKPILDNLRRAEDDTRDNYVKYVKNRNVNNKENDDSHQMGFRYAEKEESPNVAAQATGTTVEAKSSPPVCSSTELNAAYYSETPDDMVDLEEYAERNWSRYPHPDSVATTSCTDPEALGIQEPVWKVLVGVLALIITFFFVLFMRL